MSHRRYYAQLWAAAGFGIYMSTVSMSLAQEFAQFDRSASDSTLSASATRGIYGASLGYSRFSSGDEVTLSATFGIPVSAFGEAATLRIGPSVQKPNDESLRYGVRLTVEQYRPTDWGGLFLLGEFNSVNDGYFALVQPNWSNGLSADLTAVGNDGGYRETAIAGSYRFGDSPIRARVGYRFVSDEFFVGVSVNTY